MRPTYYSIFKVQFALFDERRVILTKRSGAPGSLQIVNATASGDEGIRTPDLRLAKAALSQLSYIPV